MRLLFLVLFKMHGPSFPSHQFQEIQNRRDHSSRPPKTTRPSSPLGRGQVGKIMHMAALSICLKRASAVSAQLHGKDVTSLRKAKGASSSSDALLAVFDDKLQQLRQYHARHPEPIRKRQKVGLPIADGYDLASMVSPELKKYADLMYTTDEVMGKYFDMQPVLNETSWKDVIPADSFDLLQLLSKGLAVAIKETDKLKERKKYLRFLMALRKYLESFLQRSNPLLSLKDIVDPALKDFEEQWRATGGIQGWEHKQAESSWVDDHVDKSSLDLSSFKSAEELNEAVDGNSLKTELSKLGLKCGGTPLDRAKRLFMTKDTSLDKLPKKLFAKQQTGEQHGDSTGNAGERRVDLARQEVIVTSLLNQMRPTLEATIRRAERRQSQTVKERERELEDELHGSELPEDQKKNADDDDDSDDDDTPIYNPKGVPLGWDGKPIPYWLFKLHGLNHFYACEICGNESYRGRRNFEKHFAEAKHAYGMKCLGIPNTNHFHGVTAIEDAQQLWKTLQSSLDRDRFDGDKEEEYEDSHGNVLSRTTYEDLARQGLL